MQQQNKYIKGKKNVEWKKLGKKKEAGVWTKEKRGKEHEGFFCYSIQYFKSISKLFFIKYYIKSMEPNLCATNLGILSEAQIVEIQKSSTQVNCFVAFEENPMLKVEKTHYPEPDTLLQIRGDFLVQTIPHERTIVAGFRFDYEIKFEVVPCSQKNEKADKKKHKQNSYSRLTFVFHNRDKLQVSFLAKNSPEFENFYRALETKYIVQLNFHGQFQAIQKIGKGVTANVYRVCRLRDKKSVAIKSFNREAYFESENGNGKKAFQKELKILSGLNHKNLCKFEGVYESNNSTYVVMELLGMSLFTYVQRIRFSSENKIKKILYQLLLGINQLHKKGIMHRDLKLENIMIRKESQDKFQVVIVDMGLAEYVKNEKFLYTRCGTPGYVAPEVLKIKSNDNQRYTQACDIFSLGTIFHILLFRKSLFEGADVKQVIRNNTECVINTDAEYMKTASEDALNLLMKMLETDPEKRITAEEALKHQYLQQINPKQQITERQPTSTRIQTTV